MSRARVVDPGDDDLQPFAAGGIVKATMDEPAHDPGEALAAGLGSGLREHRGDVWLDSRVHCLCGWMSAPANGSAFMRNDYVAHVVGAQVAEVARLLGLERVSRRG